jgi:hypothetical protein
MARTRTKQARAALDKFRKALEPLEGARIWQKTEVILCYKDQAVQYLVGAWTLFRKRSTGLDQKRTPA